MCHVIFKGVHVDSPGGGCDEVDSPSRLMSTVVGMMSCLVGLSAAVALMSQTRTCWVLLALSAALTGSGA